MGMFYYWQVLNFVLFLLLASAGTCIEYIYIQLMLYGTLERAIVFLNLNCLFNKIFPSDGILFKGSFSEFTMTEGFLCGDLSNTIKNNRSLINRFAIVTFGYTYQI